MGEHDDGLPRRLGGEVRLPPQQLRVAQNRGRVGRVVEHDEMNALVVKRVVHRATENLLIRLAAIKRRVVLARHVAYWHVDSARHLAKLAEPGSTHFRVIRRVRQIPREHHEVGLVTQSIYGGNRLRHRASEIGIDRGIVVVPVNTESWTKLKSTAPAAPCRMAAHPGSPDANTTPPPRQRAS